MTDPTTGLPADNIPESLAAGDRSGYTSPTNIGGYLWSTIVARELGIITAASARPGSIRTLTTLGTMEHHEPSGMYYNWYDEATGEALRTWPEDGSQRRPVRVQRRQRLARRRPARREERRTARRRTAGRRALRPDALGRLLRPGDDPGHADGAARRTDARRLLRLRPRPPRRRLPRAPTSAAATSGSPRTTTTRSCPRPGSRSYLGILTGQVPATHYFAPWRTFPATCDWSWHEMQPVGVTRTYLGHRRLRGRLHLPRHARRPGLGRKHVRGAHARRLRARGGLGAAQLGRQPPAPRAGRARARPRRGGLRLLGLLPVEQPRRRLPRVRRRRARAEPRGLLLRPGEDQLRRRLRRLPRRRRTRTRPTATASSPRTPRSSR